MARTKVQVERFSSIQVPGKSWTRGRWQLYSDNYITVCGLTLFLVLQRHVVGGALLLISIFSYKTKPPSCEVGSGRVSPHCLGGDIVKCWAGHRDKGKAWHTVLLVGSHVWAGSGCFEPQTLQAA
jgi:hypothetical protein